MTKPILKYLKTCKTIPELKTEYKKLAKKLHPDLGGSTQEMQQLNAEYDYLSQVLPAVNCKGEEYQPKQESRENPEMFRAAINAILHLHLDIEICGSWLWVHGDTKPHKDVLKAAGYRWSSNKAAWYWHDEEHASGIRHRSWSMEQIRDTYGSEAVEQQEEQQQRKQGRARIAYAV